MKSSAKSDLLDSVEANYRELLYKARWDEKTAAKIVPPLIKLLQSDDSTLLLRTLSALFYIGPAAKRAAGSIAPLLRYPEENVCDSAALALAQVSLHSPEPAIDPLIEMTQDPDRLKYAMFGLIQLGPAAGRAAPVFVRAYGNKDSRIRRLALRAIKECQVESAIAVQVLERAKSDRSKVIRDYAGKILDLYRSKSAPLSK